MKKIFILFAIWIFVASISVMVCNAQPVNETITKAINDMAMMKNDGIEVTRYNDTLQMAIELYNNKGNIERVKKLLDEALRIKHQAYKCLDELSALRTVIENTKDIEQEPVWKMYYQAEKEFKAERYEESLKLIDKTYDKISELEALQTKLALFYKSISGGLVSFVASYWIYMLVSIFLLMVFYILFRKSVTAMLLERKLKDLSRRKDSLKKQIIKEQKRYFKTKEIGEDTYKIRIMKYGEVLRDIDRKILLLKEELNMLKKIRNS